MSNASDENEINSLDRPNRITSYFKHEKLTLLLITISGIIYNVGMIVGPWFEGQLVLCLYRIINKKSQFEDMLLLTTLYICSIGLVQCARFIKRFYVRRFGNSVNRNMKLILYRNLINKSNLELTSENTGALMTKAIVDVDACSEGMRKFTTEIFDTGVVMISYIVMLLVYDWRLALISMIFPPIAYIIAQRLKKVVEVSAARYKESAGRLNNDTMDRIENAITYRIAGLDVNRNQSYETHLNDYEKKAVRAEVWENSMQPIYLTISMASVIFILYFGAQNVRGMGFTSWNIAAFTTFVSCFTKLATKSSKAAKLFNAVQKAKVSWLRIKPLMNTPEDIRELEDIYVERLVVSNLSFAYDSKNIFSDLTFTAVPGQIIGVTGEVASGKSTFGKIFLGELQYRGSIKLDTREMYSLNRSEISSVISYMGHETELLEGSIRENIMLGREDEDIEKYLRAVCIDNEIDKMSNGIDTHIDNDGMGLSGGQQARVALARTLYNRKSIIVLDDPFSAVDAETEMKLFNNIKEMAVHNIVIIISHRLLTFPMMDKVIWLNRGNAIISDHKHLMNDNEIYSRLFRIQTNSLSGGSYEKE